MDHHSHLGGRINAWPMKTKQLCFTCADGLWDLRLLCCFCLYLEYVETKREGIACISVL